MNTEWKLVPVRLTPEMVEAARKIECDINEHDCAYWGEVNEDMWSAMLAAAPKPSFYEAALMRGNQFQPVELSGTGNQIEGPSVCIAPVETTVVRGGLGEFTGSGTFTPHPDNPRATLLTSLPILEDIGLHEGVKTLVASELGFAKSTGKTSFDGNELYDAVSALGITSFRRMPDRFADAVWFFNCRNVPIELPDWLEVRKETAEDFVGRGAMTREIANSILADAMGAVFDGSNVWHNVKVEPGRAVVDTEALQGLLSRLKTSRAQIYDMLQNVPAPLHGDAEILAELDRQIAALKEVLS